MRPETIDTHPVLLLVVVLVVVGVAGWRAGEVAVVNPLLKLLLTALADQAEVVDPGRRRRFGRRLRAGVDVTLDVQRDRQPGMPAA